jgi:hypothetical protein
MISEMAISGTIFLGISRFFINNFAYEILIHEATTFVNKKCTLRVAAIGLILDMLLEVTGTKTKMNALIFYPVGMRVQGWTGWGSPIVRGEVHRKGRSRALVVCSEWISKHEPKKKIERIII